MNMRSYSCCSGSKTKSRDIIHLSILLKVISEANRLRLLCVLLSGEHCVCELRDHIGISQSLLSHHLKDLKVAGLVQSEKRGLNVYYSLTPLGAHIAKTVVSISIQKEGAL